MNGEPAVPRVEKPRNSGQFRGRIQRPSPPDLPGEKDDRFRATVHFAVAGSDSHFPEQFRRRQSQQRLCARVLQGGKAEAARFEGAAEAAFERSARGALAIEKDPAAKSAPSFCISYF